MATVTVTEAAPHDPPSTLRRTWPAHTAAVAALGYAAPHFWWGAGIGAMFPGDFAGAPQDDLEAAKDAHPQAAWGLFWYGLFLLWGITLGIAARRRLRDRRDNP